MELDDFVYGAFVELYFRGNQLPDGTTLVGKLQRNGVTDVLINSNIGADIMMRSATNTIEAGRYRLVVTWQKTATSEPIQEDEFDIIIRARK